MNIGANARVHMHMMTVAHRCWNPFIKLTHNPLAVQHSLLERILSSQAETTFGRQYQFSRLRGYHEFRLGVPIHSYENLRAYIQSQEEDKKRQLNHEQPIGYALTSGTTGKPKLIPVLSSTYQIFRRLSTLKYLCPISGHPKDFSRKDVGHRRARS